jgi:hypothetical protein
VNRPFNSPTRPAVPTVVRGSNLRLGVGVFCVLLFVLAVLGLIVGDVGLFVLFSSLGALLAMLTRIYAQLEDLQRRTAAIALRLEQRSELPRE